MQGVYQVDLACSIADPSSKTLVLNVRNFDVAAFLVKKELPRH